MTQSLFSNRQRFKFASGGSSKPYELELSFFIVFILSGVYIAYELMAEPRGGHPFGHWLGIIGTLLMVMTETLYSLRKRTRLLNWAGPVRRWLAFHIITGIVGPFLVLMHTGLEFRGLAGLTFVLTVIVAGSGFIGRYLYTALPRSLTGVVTSRQQIEMEAGQLETAVTQFQQQKSQRAQQIIHQLSQRHSRRNPLLTVFGRSFYQWRYRRQLNRALRQLDEIEESQRRQLQQLLTRKRELDRQAEMLDAARRLLRYWHILHVPVGLTLFFSIVIHIIATFYFRAGLF
jgi:signal transduction histidine kinase